MSNRIPIQIAQPLTGDEEWQATRESIVSGWLTQGPKVAEFERVFAAYHHANHAIATTSCTTALHLILAALGIQKGDEVIVPAFTWVATANVIEYCGAKPVFVDVDPHTFTIIPSQIKQKITANTKAIIPVHLFGLCADINAIAEAAPGIPIIEDAACAAGSRYQNKMAGTLGAAGAFSFHPRKPITTGEGGMVTTNDDDLAERMKKLRNHGAEISEEQRHIGSKPYLYPDFNMLGFNYRMTDLQGAVGIEQMKKLDDIIIERRKWAAYYQKELQDVQWLRTPIEPEGMVSCWQSFVCWVDETKSPMPRNILMETLLEKGIHTRPGTHAVHALGYYRDKYGYQPGDYPNALACEQCSLAIPLHNQMSDDDYAYIVETIRSI